MVFSGIDMMGNIITIGSWHLMIPASLSASNYSYEQGKIPSIIQRKWGP